MAILKLIATAMGIVFLVVLTILLLLTAVLLIIMVIDMIRDALEVER